MLNNPEYQPSTSKETHIPKVSIGLLVYNGEKYIKEAIDSVLAQTYTDFVLVISDNASTDGTEAICREYLSKDSRVKYIRQPTNIGSLNNGNYLLEHARGDYFTFLAHDDYLDSSFLEVMVQYLDEHSDVVLCSCDFRQVQEGTVLRTITLDELRDDKDWVEVRRNFFTCSFAVYTLVYGVYRISVLHEYNIYVQSGFRGMALFAEYSMLSKVALHGRIVALPKVLQTYRIFDYSLSRTEKKHIRPLFHLINATYCILKYQVRVAMLSKLSIREKAIIFTKMFFHDTPVIFTHAYACLPRVLQRLLSPGVKILRALHHKFILRD